MQKLTPEKRARLEPTLALAATWNGFAESQLGCALTLVDAELEPDRVLECVEQAQHALGVAAAQLARFVATWAELEDAPPPEPETDGENHEAD